MEALAWLLPIEHTAIQVVHALKSDRVTAGGASPLADRTVPMYELSWFNGVGYIKVLQWWAIPDTSDSFASVPSLATFIRHGGLNDTVTWVKENLVKMAEEEVFYSESHRKWSPPLRRGAPTRKEEDAKAACKDWLKYRREYGNTTALRLDPEWFEYPSGDMGRSEVAVDCHIADS